MNMHWRQTFIRSSFACRFQTQNIHKDAPWTLYTRLHAITSCQKRAYTSSETLVSDIGKVTPKSTRVRFAPSPTGYLHLGGLRTALYNYLFARQNGGKCILRIEDTDQNRYVSGATESLIRAMEWAGIKFDEGPGIGGPHEPYYQSQRSEIYKKHAEDLIEKGHAYRCFCSSERLSLVRLEAQKLGKTVSYDRKCVHLSKEESQERAGNGEMFVVRMKVPEGKTIVQDEVHGRVEFSNKEVDDSVLLKSDGFPTYHLANVVDDYIMGITHVIRGQEWLPSAPKHVMLYRMFGWGVPKFAHVPLLLNQDKSKLSKRSGDVNVEDYKDKGYFPEAVANFVALLGWHPGSTDEIFDMDGLVAAFSLKNIQQSNAVVLREKLDWINKMHLLRRAETSSGLQEMAAILRPKLEADLGPLSEQYSDDYIAQVIGTLKERIKNLYDIPTLCSYYFQTPIYTTEESAAYRNKVGDDTLRTILPMALERFRNLEKRYDKEDVKEILKYIADSHKMKLSTVMNALRYTVSGVKIGAGVPETIVTLGRPCIVDRIERVLTTVSS
ncbi:putative glutamyl-tRNA synthetase [Lobosporangium transversale]|uniref:Glutamate--tRNA ligase, mitochondrial n=1 Tax=Lobosporangium transversale TaxID=64571 RepID=A0A1Y2GSL7_9FUNG|nr:putative glutamyl-tRNA synthetase [Lobosporangium transversale]ORZ21803.1 putative glutamyl-tRNA synthetase [Lobosporangium transversale]|eukprot:XP_021883054.1 putative glutamyl-tRNA synthetase [Lobosporangium transversale]